ncbi:polyadenylate-binding protein 7-like isoform X2 [Prosopis cineraria]|uniref:polyadenylate-binding protein 7-like isoform X2 n=1 Tax=Prosopis cineraria TaxID=364024 RepID=UPI00240F8FB5|nr:polyadenylate-binding protein 7-like isoform X2 [Prosopis cineraria]XP_054804445.1 polyadenylate-binding protein 7-like isoform X2 [Prosopis cineraria]
MAVPLTVAAARASLYVGDLHPDVSDGQLLELFLEFKSLTSVRICRDSSTGRSLCYGYVNFNSPQDAIRAIEVKNHFKLNGKMIRVMWTHRDPEARKSGKANVFVKNLAEPIDNAGLHELFQKFGKILSTKVVTSEYGKSKGYGFVQFESEDSANVAIEKLNGSTVRDKLIYVGKFVKKSERLLPGPDSKFTNLFMKNLDPETTEELLQEKFAPFGNIVNLAVAKDNNGVSKGFGFVNYDNPDDAKRAMETMNGSRLGSKIIYVARAQKKAEREKILHHQFEEKRRQRILKYKGSNIYVKNIDDDVNDEELRHHFSSCGTITSAKVMRDDKGISKGFGFVCFSAPEEANRAVNIFHGCMFHRKLLYVAIAQRKEDRQAQLKVQYAPGIAGLAGPPTAVIPGGYPPYYYEATGVVSQLPYRPGLVYQPLGLRPGWRPNGFAPPTRPAQQAPFSVPATSMRPHRQNRSRMNGQAISQGNVRLGKFMPQAQHPSQPMVSSKESTTRQVRFAFAAQEWQQQKQLLGEHIYRRVHKLKPGSEDYWDAPGNGNW